MDFPQDASIRAAWRADFEEHLPLSEEELRRLYAARDRRRVALALAGLRSLFGPSNRFGDANREARVLRVSPFMPPI